MTKFHILSDLHLEMGDYVPPSALSCDYVILAGDIALRDDAFPWIHRHFPNTPAIYINGNHEYYKNYFAATIASHKHKEQFYPNISFLENEIHYLHEHKICIYGGTMWTDFRLHHTPVDSMLVAQGAMNDYHLIRLIDEHRMVAKLYPSFTARQHERYLRGLQDAVNGLPDDYQLVVVSHHAPSPKSISPEYVDDKLNPAYASDLTELIMKIQPALWVHGHTHTSFDYEIGKTRVVCNPRDYPRGSAANPRFDPHLVVEVPARN